VLCRRHQLGRKGEEKEKKDLSTKGKERDRKFLHSQPLLRIEEHMARINHADREEGGVVWCTGIAMQACMSWSFEGGGEGRLLMGVQVAPCSGTKGCREWAHS